MPFPVDIKWVRQTEAKLGVKFPASFVVAMVSMNGGSASTTMGQFELFPFFDASDKKRLKRTCNSIDRETASARENWDGFPPSGVSIGANGGGDLLVLMPMDDRPDLLQYAIYWWHHETSEVEPFADDFRDLART